MNSDYKFDLDLKRGQVYEEKLKDCLATKIEVKTDFGYDKTGNVAIETHYKGNPSGILKTEAEYYAICLPVDESFILVKVSKLKELIYSKCHKVVKGGDNNWSTLALIKAEDLIR